MNKLGNTVLYQFGKIVGEEEKVNLLESCVFDLDGIEFCKGVKKKNWGDIVRSYHWLKRPSEIKQLAMCQRASVIECAWAAGRV